MESFAHSPGLKLDLQGVLRAHPYRFASEVEYGEENGTGFEFWGYCF